MVRCSTAEYLQLSMCVQIMATVALRCMPGLSGSLSYHPSLEGAWQSIQCTPLTQFAAMDNNAGCFVSALNYMSPCLFAITSTQQSLVKQTITEAQSEFIRVRWCNCVRP